eukprot:1883042-Pleurochrysis_carterae.AAC.1
MGNLPEPGRSPSVLMLSRTEPHYAFVTHSKLCFHITICGQRASRTNHPPATLTLFVPQADAPLLPRIVARGGVENW